MIPASVQRRRISYGPRACVVALMTNSEAAGTASLITSPS
jgi:hypothetical protein